MNHKSDDIASFDFNNLTLLPPIISAGLLVSLARPAISNDLMLKQSAIGDNLSIELEPPAIGDDLTQEFIHLLIPSEKNSNSETKR
jgi:hypothetical protein